MRIRVKRFVIVFYFILLCIVFTLFNEHKLRESAGSAVYFRYNRNDNDGNIGGMDQSIDSAGTITQPPPFLLLKWIRTAVKKIYSKTINSNSDSGSDLKSDQYYRVVRLWPEETNESDRILEQIDFFDNSTMQQQRQIKIYLPHGTGAWGVAEGGVQFESCPASNCLLNERDKKQYDAVLFRNTIISTLNRTRPDQVWIFYTLESPQNLGDFKGTENLINWTATYRFDSDIVTPYEKYVLYDDPNSSNIDGYRLKDSQRHKHETMLVDYASKKNSSVAWFVSNCFTNNNRLDYARRLNEHIRVDIFGSCGSMSCSRYNAQCFDMLRNHYRFYLSFENSNCQDYITEKFFVNGLQNDVIPIVMGGRKEEYERVAPPHSFIHVDDFDSPEQLAEYLHVLSNNRTLYNEYFRWKHKGRFIDTKFWCRLCALLNKPKQKVYAHFDEWWHNSNTCTSGKWPTLGETTLANDDAATFTSSGQPEYEYDKNEDKT